MEHITVTDRGGQTVKLLPDEGYQLKNTLTGAIYSEACCEAERAAVFVAIVNETEVNAQ